MPLHRSAEPRGSTLLLTTGLLLVLTIVGVAAVRLASQERGNAAAKRTRDQLEACASAARAQLWAEISRSGTGVLQMDTAPTTLTLPDGTELTVPAHYSFAGKDGESWVELIETTPVFTAKAMALGDLTNRMPDPRALSGSLGNRILARCRDPKGRELLVEFTVKFALQ